MPVGFAHENFVFKRHLHVVDTLAHPVGALRAKIKTDHKGRFEFLAAHIEKNANQIIDQIIKIAELLTDADVSLYRGNN